MEDNDLIEKPIGVRILRGVLLGTGLLLLNLIFVLGPYIAVWGVLISFVASGIAIFFSGLLLAATYLFSLPFTVSIPILLTQYPEIMLLSGGLLFGLGSMLTVLSVWASKYLVIGTGRYVTWQVSLIRGDIYE